MKKIGVSIMIMSILLIGGYEILSESKTIMDAVFASFELWIHNLFPSLFPFFVLSEILTNYGFIEFIGEFCKPIFEKLFRINGNAAFVFFMSMLSGFPSNAKYTRELYLQGKLTEKEATKILMFSHFSNPLFILGAVSLTFLKSKQIGILILICHYISNIIIGLLVRNYAPSPCSHSKFSIKKPILEMHNKRIHNDKRFGSIITNSLMNSIQTLLLILGVVTTFAIITTIIDNNFHPSLISKTILSGFLEMTQGLKCASLLTVSTQVKAIFMIAILSFGGLSVHTQIVSIISDTKIRYLPFLLARLLHVVISVILLLICFILM